MFCQKNIIDDIKFVGCLQTGAYFIVINSIVRTSLSPVPNTYHKTICVPFDRVKGMIRERFEK